MQKVRSLATRRLLGTAVAIGAAAALPAAVQLPGSSRSSYILPVPENDLWTTVSVLSVDDTAQNGYRMVGIPDGMGAFDNGDGTFTVLVNHELGNNVGIVRAHGSRGSFVSRWVIRKSDYAVLSGEDLIKRVRSWDAATSTWRDATTTELNFGRFCSADLPDVSAFYNAASGLGTTARIFMNGEEIGAEGRGMAHVVTGPETGTSYNLPATGLFSWENSLACPYPQDKTIVVGTDDGTGGQVYVYIGTKRATGNEVEKAGLVGGVLYGIRFGSMDLEPTAAFSKAARTASFSMVPLGDVTLKTGAELEAMSTPAGVTQFRRPEDGHWNPANPSEFWFVTTASFTTPSRLWVLRFNDIQNPEAGGIAELAWDGSNDGDKSVRMMDNMTVTDSGKVIITEDPGNQAYRARVHSYDIKNKTLTPLLVSAAEFFTSGSASFLTNDEEHSGVIDISHIVGRADTYLLATQVHAAATGPNAAELVEGGQLLLMTPSTRQVNIASRGQVTQADPMIAGFIIQGTEKKTVLIRAVGPSLAQFGITTAIGNPKLQVYKGTTPIAENDSWQFNPNAAGISATGLAPSDANEAAVMLELEPGAYTAIVSDVAGASGTSLVDVYEFDMTPGHTDARLVNLSTRAPVGTSFNVLIGGLIIDGVEPKQVLIRALGPTLGSLGVSNPLGDPRFTIYNAANAVVGTSDDYAADAATVAALNANPALRPSNSVEAALVRTLAPGTYTVVVEGVNGATGTALLDANEL